MCVDSAGVIYGLFSAPAVLTNELEAARWHAADNAAGLLLQVSSRPSPRLPHSLASTPGVPQSFTSLRLAAFDSFVQKKREKKECHLLKLGDETQL